MNDKMKTKTALCETCQFGLVYCWEWKDDSEIPKEERGPFRRVKCLIENGFLDGIVIQCNKYKKQIGGVTYHDPDFKEYERKIMGGKHTDQYHDPDFQKYENTITAGKEVKKE